MIKMSHELYNEATSALRQRLRTPGEDLNHGLLLCLLNNAAMLTEVVVVHIEPLLPLISKQLMENAAQPCAKPSWLVLYKAGMRLMRKAGPAAFANSRGLAYLELNRPCVVSRLLSPEHGAYAPICPIF